jgi:hypothetical protein
MFEPPQQKQSSSSNSLWIGLVLALVAVAAIVYFVVAAKGPASPTANSALASAPIGKADPVRDLKIRRAAMDKDSSGTIAIWSIAMQNRSPSYSYSNIEYETSYLNAEGRVIATNKGTLSLTLGPDEERNTQVRDLTYPSGTATYKIRVTSATSQAE